MAINIPGGESQTLPIITPLSTGGPLIDIGNLYYEGAETDPCPDGYERTSIRITRLGAADAVIVWYCAPIPVDLESMTLAGIAVAVRWVKDRLAELRHGLIKAVAEFLKDPIAAILGLIILVGLSIVLTVVYEALLAIEIIAKVADFIAKVGKMISKILSFMQVDLLITIMRLKGTFDPEWHSALADLYDALGSLAEEIGRDFSFISVFAEIDRSILVTAYSLSGNAWLNSQVEYAKGVTEFLGGVESKMLEYRKNPEQIFIDIQNAIIKDKATQVDKDLGRIMAAIGAAADWIRDKGNILIDGLHDLEDQIAKFPQEIQDAIAPWYNKQKKIFDDFVQEQWNPFWEKIDKANEIIADYLSRHEVDIDELKKRINDPFDWLRMLLLMDMDSQTDWLARLQAFLNGDKVKYLDALADTLDVIVADLDTPVEYTPPSIETTPIIVESFIPESLIKGTPPSMPPAWYKAESDALVHNPGQQVNDRKSWYTGE